jgi:hypothetical protein
MSGPSRDPDAVAQTAEVNAIYLTPEMVSAGVDRVWPRTDSLTP